MAVFEYTALSADGKKQNGTQESDNSRQVRQQLREKGLTPLTINIVEAKTSASSKTSSALTLSFGRKLSTRALTLITRQLATLIQAALPIEEALSAVAAHQEKPWIKNLILSVRSNVMEGHTLAASLDNFPRHFPQMYRATIAAGEYAGHLDKILLRLADHSETQAQSKQKVQLSLLYPAILVVVSIVIIAFLLGFVVPDIIKVFVDTGQPLPTITKVLIASSKWIQSWWWLLLIIIIAMFFLKNQLLKSESLRLRWHRFMLTAPIVGRFILSFNTARFASTLSILTQSGVSLVDAMHIASKVVGNDAIRESIINAIQNVSEGVSLYRSLEKSGYFPPMMLHMIASGEATGELDNVLEKTANNQQMELENRISMLVGLFEPFMLVVMGSIVMLIVLAVLLPILNMNTLIGS